MEDTLKGKSEGEDAFEEAELNAEQDYATWQFLEKQKLEVVGKADPIGTSTLTPKLQRVSDLTWQRKPTEGVKGIMLSLDSAPPVPRPPATGLISRTPQRFGVPGRPPDYSGDPPTPILQAPPTLKKVPKSELRQKRRNTLKLAYAPRESEAGEITWEAKSVEDEIWTTGILRLKEPGSKSPELRLTGIGPNPYLPVALLLDSGNTSHYGVLSKALFDRWMTKARISLPLSPVPQRVCGIGGKQVQVHGVTPLVYLEVPGLHMGFSTQFIVIAGGSLHVNIGIRDLKKNSLDLQMRPDHTTLKHGKNHIRLTAKKGVASLLDSNHAELLIFSINEILPKVDQLGEDDLMKLHQAERRLNSKLGPKSILVKGGQYAVFEEMGDALSYCPIVKPRKKVDTAKMICGMSLMVPATESQELTAERVINLAPGEQRWVRAKTTFAYGQSYFVKQHLLPCDGNLAIISHIGQVSDPQLCVYLAVLNISLAPVTVGRKEVLAVMSPVSASKTNESSETEVFEELPQGSF